MMMMVAAAGREELFISLVSLLVANVSDFDLLLRFDVRDGLYLQDHNHNDGQTERKRTRDSISK